MSFTHQLRLGGSYSLDTHIRFQPPFKIRVMKLMKQSTTTRLSSTEKDSGLQVPPPSPMKPTTGVVRQGAVRVKEDRVHPRNWFSKIRWLVLCEKQLSLHPSQTKALKASILLSDIKKLERTDRIPYGLVLQTKNGRRYLLSFESDNDLYDWQDDISARSMGVGLPYNFVHETHSTFNPSTGAITGLPEGWDQVLFNKFGPGETEPQISLVIRVPGSNVPYEWRVQSEDSRYSYVRLQQHGPSSR
ncbi:hypothetical protein B0H13DRAFT_710624 [Mycena leptocephala]|nr:hypothetical protein B0H13DRAFT_710624 [Mycena leptocephala]